MKLSFKTVKLNLFFKFFSIFIKLKELSSNFKVLFKNSSIYKNPIRPILSDFVIGSNARQAFIAKIEKI